MSRRWSPALPASDRHLSRRQFIVGGTVLAALVAAGCGDDADDEAAEAPDTTPATTGSTSPGGTSAGGSRTVAGVLGNTYTFDAAPSRVFGDLDVLASLGVVPVGCELYESAEWAPYQQAVLDPSTTTVRYTDGPNFEAIAATRPDLILTAFADESYHRVLADIAPTVFIDNTKPWREVIRAAAVPVFREAEAEQAIAEVEGAFERFRSANPDRIGTTPTAFYLGSDGAVTVMTAESSLNALLQEAGFASITYSGDPYGDSVSDELLAEQATGDFLLVFVGLWRLSDPDEPVPAAVQQRLDSTLFTNLPAAAGGIRVFPDEGGRAAYYFTPLYLPVWIDHLTAAFA